MILAARDLSIAYGAALAVRGVNLSIDAGEALGLIGESGCGKSTLALGMLGLLPEPGRIVGGEVEIAGGLLRSLPRDALRRRRWRDFAYVPQSAMNALDPVRSLRAQFEATARAHGYKGHVGDRAAALFAQVGLDPAWLDRFPHQFSGGMRQRAVIALALLFDPPLLIADEPTTGLDVIVQREIMTLLRRLQADRALALVLVSHDLGVIAGLCHRVAVMYAGRIVEQGTIDEILTTPRHPYTMALRLAFTDLDDPLRPAISIPGAPLGIGDPSIGCAFAPRCPFAVSQCRTDAPALAGHGEAAVACHRGGEAETLRSRAADTAMWGEP